MGAGPEPGSTYSLPVAFIFVFNLVIGVGALNLPHASYAAGLVIALVMLLIMGFLSYVTMTFIIEAMAIGNALNRNSQKTLESQPLLYSDGKVPALLNTSLINDDALSEEELSSYGIRERIEMGRLSEMYLSWFGKIIFNAIIIVYLFGDLAIYAVAVPTSLQRLAPGFTAGSWTLSCDNSYYLYLAGFVVVVVPWAYFNFQKTKYLQIFTMVIRNTALLTMIILAIIKIAKGEGKVTEVQYFNWQNFPAFFGATVYAFMCHHSLPGIVTPIENKKKLFPLLFGDMASIFIVYSLLVATALYAFGDSLQNASLYTFAFQNFAWQPLAIFLESFPIFTLSSNFPLIAITLRNNIIMLFKSVMGEDRVRASPVLRPGRERLADVIFTSVAVIPALCIAFATSNVSFLVKITGSFPGLSIMFIAPSLMVFFARRRAAKELDSDESNPHRSPFGHVIWIVLVWLFSAAAIGLISYNLITSSASGESPADFCSNPTHNNSTSAPFVAPISLASPISSVPIAEPLANIPALAPPVEPTPVAAPF